MVKKKSIKKEVEIKKVKGKEENRSFDIISGTELIRTYSNEVHGKDARQLAEQFAKKRGYEIK